MFIQNNKVRYKYGVKIVKIELSVVKEGKVKNKIPEISSWTSSSTRGLSRCGRWCPGRCAARCHRPGPSPAASCTSRWPGRSSWWLRAKWPAVSPTSVLVSPCYRFSCCPQAPYGLVGWLEMEFLLFKLLSEASGLKSRKAPAWRLDSLQMMVAGIMVGKGVGLGGGRGGWEDEVDRTVTGATFGSVFLSRELQLWSVILHTLILEFQVVSISRWVLKNIRDKNT